MKQSFTYYTCLLRQIFVFGYRSYCYEHFLHITEVLLSCW